jgi:hypothetical protein
MKLSKEPTGMIIVKASVNSEWDSCDFILLRIDDMRYNHSLRECIEAAKQLEDLKGFYQISVWDSPFGWFKDDGENEELTNLLAQMETGWSYIDISEEEINNLSYPEQSIDGQQMRITADGYMCFNGLGKHTGEEFYSESFKLDIK